MWEILTRHQLKSIRAINQQLLQDGPEWFQNLDGQQQFEVALRIYSMRREFIHMIRQVLWIVALFGGIGIAILSKYDVSFLAH